MIGNGVASTSRAEIIKLFFILLTRFFTDTERPQFLLFEALSK